jgi:hypothetical protein
MVRLVDLQLVYNCIVLVSRVTYIISLPTQSSPNLNGVLWFYICTCAYAVIKSFLPVVTIRSLIVNLHGFSLLLFRFFSIFPVISIFVVTVELLFLLFEGCFVTI